MRWSMLAILFVVRLAMGYQFQSVGSVSAQLVDSFGFSYAQVGTLIGLFLLPGVFMAMPSGAMTRAATDKTLLMIGAAVMAAGSTVMAFAETPTQLHAGRLLTGVGGTLFNLVLTKMVSEWFFGREIITALSVMLVSWPIGIALGLLTQGRMAGAFGWPSVMAGGAPSRSPSGCWARPGSGSVSPAPPAGRSNRRAPRCGACRRLTRRCCWRPTPRAGRGARSP